MIKKTNNAYKTIGEVAELLNLKNKNTGRLNTYILRFWEKEFMQVKPHLLNNGRRYYDKKTIDLLVEIKFLLKDKGMTIKGVKKLLNDKRFILDDQSHDYISMANKNLKSRLNNISNILKDIKKIR
tara:strand:+ start:223 stop:600 length:378 start_codon:yes stop_codon:yes gene_type:complete